MQIKFDLYTVGFQQSVNGVSPSRYSLISEILDPFSQVDKLHTLLAHPRVIDEAVENKLIVSLINL